MSTPIDHFMAGFRHAEKIHKVKESVADEISPLITWDVISSKERQRYIDQLNKEQAENDLKWEQSEEEFRDKYERKEIETK